MLDKPTETSEGTACEARRTSTHSVKLRRVCVRMCRATDWEPQAMYCGAALRGYRGIPPVLLFFCRRFLFQIKRKCRNAGSVYHLIIVRSEGRNQLSTIQLYYNFVSATPISDSRKGCPYEVRGLKFVRIFERRAMFSTTVNNRHFENSVPLARHRCVESPHPTRPRATNLLIFCLFRTNPHNTAYLYFLYYTWLYQ